MSPTKKNSKKSSRIIDVGNMDRETKQRFGRILVVTISIISLISVSVIFASFEVVEYDEFALKKNNWTGQVDYDTIYEPGRYLIGPLSEFIKLPSTIQTIAFNPHYDATDSEIKSRTKNGLSISFDISYQYKLNKTEIGELVKEYGLNFEDTYIKTSRDVFREVCGQWTALEFYTNLTDIGDAMHDALVDSFSHLYASIYAIQLTNIDLPDSFEEAREEAEVAKMQEEIAQYIQNAALIEIQTQLLQAEADANISRIEALIAAEIVEINAQAEANATEIESIALANRAMLLMNATFHNDTNGDGIVDPGEIQNVFTSQQVTEYLIVALITDSENADIYMGIDPTFWTSL